MNEGPEIIISIFNSPTEDERIVYGLDAKYNLWRWIIGHDKKWEKIGSNARQVIWPEMGEKPKEKLTINDVYAILAQQAQEPWT